MLYPTRLDHRQQFTADLRVIDISPETTTVSGPFAVSGNRTTSLFHSSFELQVMQRAFSDFEGSLQKRLLPMIKDDNEADLIASIVRETLGESGEEELPTRSSATEVIEQTLLDFGIFDKLNLRQSDIVALVDGLDEHGLLACEDADSTIEEDIDVNDTASLVGKRCVALMTIFDSEQRAEVSEWSSGVVKDVEVEDGAPDLTGASIHVEFDKFGVIQVVGIEEVCLEEEADEEDLHGVCPFCERDMPLTFHHLIPKSTHKVMKKKTGMDTHALNSHGVNICRPCHSAVHRAESNMSLALSYNSADTLKAHPAIQKWISYASKQKPRVGCR